MSDEVVLMNEDTDAVDEIVKRDFGIRELPPAKDPNAAAAHRSLKYLENKHLFRDVPGFIKKLDLTPDGRLAVTYEEVRLVFKDTEATPSPAAHRWAKATPHDPVVKRDICDALRKLYQQVMMREYVRRELVLSQYDAAVLSRTEELATYTASSRTVLGEGLLAYYGLPTVLYGLHVVVLPTEGCEVNPGVRIVLPDGKTFSQEINVRTEG